MWANFAAMLSAERCKVCRSCRSRQELSNEYSVFTCKNRLRYSREWASQSLEVIQFIFRFTRSYRPVSTCHLLSFCGRKRQAVLTEALPLETIRYTVSCSRSSKNVQYMFCKSSATSFKKYCVLVVSTCLQSSASTQPRTNHRRSYF